MKDHYHSQDRRDMIRGLDLTGEAEGHRHVWDSWMRREPPLTENVNGHEHLVTLGLVTSWIADNISVRTSEPK